jgi:hypothetical protein
VSSSVTVKDIDKGWKKITNEISKKKPTSVSVGVIGKHAQSVHAGSTDEFPITIADVASWNEFGVGVPERSFLRSTIDMFRATIQERLENDFAKMVAGKLTKADVLERAGLFIQGLIQERIAAGIEPENSPVTIERKGSATPLIDKGQLRASISYEVT